MSNSITADVFAALDILVLERVDFGRFRITGTPPDWLQLFCRHQVKSGMQILIPQQEFPFLENFLIDAEELWNRNDKNQLSSGIWYQLDLSGKEHHFEATAIGVKDTKILLIKLLYEEFQEKRNLIQKARENQLNYQYITKENQKKDILIHCIIHDIAGQLSGINCCLMLLETENLTPKAREYLEIGKKQALQEEILIRDILNAFSAEITSLESFTVDADTAPNLLTSVQEVIQLLSPTFVLNKVNLQLADNIDQTSDWRVIGDKSRLNRMIANLAENAFRHSPMGSTVTIGLQQEEDSILVTVDDQGSGIPAEIAKHIFEKFSQAGNSGRVGLGLYFCRMTVERWGGQIGYLPLPQGGSRFWVRLLKPKPKT
ncbi:HAMP domain-containing sensor histidine kinase [Fischerella thermalis]|uniref:sensor histidine kinase n=1 Tax=Fischerella thermalis TaxID=372787 RepID=UPI00307EC495